MHDECLNKETTLYREKYVGLQNIKIDDAFWNRYTKLVPEVIIPYQWEVLNDNVEDAAPSYCVRNFKIAAGELNIERKGPIFQDSDAAKWLEAVAYSLIAVADPELERTADELIDLIGRAQCEDGYLNTYYTIVEKNYRWQNLVEGHELYCAGHLIEAAVAYYITTKKMKLLDIACKFADLISEVFGPGELQMHAYPGHPEIELALVRLYRVTGNRKYLETAKYFIDIRGVGENYFLKERARPDFENTVIDILDYDPAYAQSHIPVREQNEAVGHAVRAVYLYAAMADIADIYKDEELFKRCEMLWNNIVDKRMYITGGIGSSGFQERFTADYDLPNDTAYAETCASIGLAMFGARMARITKNARYMDVVERVLYNTVRAGISLDGNHYFYVNPLEVWPDICLEHTSRAHVKANRQKWYVCACCPTNVARTLSSLGQYIYTYDDSKLYVNLYIQNTLNLPVGNKEVQIKIETDYPRNGNVRLHITAERVALQIYVRIPSFADGFKAAVNGKPHEGPVTDGYFQIDRIWDNDIVEITFPVQPKIVYANPLVRANSGKIAIIRGPEVYCLEEVDNGDNLSAVYLDPDSTLTEVWDNDLLGGTSIIKCNAWKLSAPGLDTSDSTVVKPEKTEMDLTLTPYGSWGNRQPGEMIVWMHSII